MCMTDIKHDGNITIFAVNIDTKYVRVVIDQKIFLPSLVGPGRHLSDFCPLLFLFCLLFLHFADNFVPCKNFTVVSWLQPSSIFLSFLCLSLKVLCKEGNMHSNWCDRAPTITALQVQYCTSSIVAYVLYDTVWNCCVGSSSRMALR